MCDGALGPACVSTVNTCTHNDPVVLQWLRNTQDYHSSSEEEEEEEEEEGREEEGEEKESTPDSRGPSSSGWGVDDCDSVHTMARGDRSPTVSSGVQPSDSPVSPPVSCKRNNVYVCMSLHIVLPLSSVCRQRDIVLHWSPLSS